MFVRVYPITANPFVLYATIKYHTVTQWSLPAVAFVFIISRRSVLHSTALSETIRADGCVVTQGVTPASFCRVSYRARSRCCSFVLYALK